MGPFCKLKYGELGMFSNNRFTPSVAAPICMLLFGLPAMVASAEENFGVDSFSGSYVMTFHGSFSSAPPPPLPNVVLDFEAAQVGRLTFDGGGQVDGAYTLTFHNPEIPFPIRSRFAVRATYSVGSDGHLVIEAEEFRIDASGGVGETPANAVTYECYIVQSRRLAECLQHSLISYQQGPTEKLLPHTMSGSLQRQTHRRRYSADW
jgi:hypothetical protein